MAKKSDKPERRTTKAHSSRPVAGRTNKPRKHAPSKRKASSEKVGVIYVHGISKHPPEDQWKNEWDLALFGRPMACEKTISAYWSDILHGKSISADAATKRVDKKSVTAKTILDDAGIGAKNKAAHEFTESLLETLGLRGAESTSAGYRSKVLPLPSRGRGPIARRFMQWFVRDAAQYFFDTKKRDQIKQRLIDRTPRTGEPFVLVTHSLGTVIAYEVLTELSINERAEAALLVTMGSPLGLQEVQDELLKRIGSLSVPAGIQAWKNFADGFDPVALDATLADDFAARNGVAIEDHRIGNTEFGLFKGWNPHHSGGYLAHPKVRNVVYRSAHFDPTSRFLVARDVAERFASDERQPVLIEILEPGYWAMDEKPGDLSAREDKLPVELNSLEGRGQYLASKLKKIVVKNGAKEAGAAQVVQLRKYVSARLTPAEIQQLSLDHRELNVFRVWRSSPKRALIDRSRKLIGADAAEVGYMADGRGITWAVLDTGCRWDHPHFKDSQIQQVWDCTTSDDAPVALKNPKNGDADGHGTHVCGIIAGKGTDENGVEFSGMAPRTALVVYKVLDDHGNGEDAWIIKAIDHIWRTNANAFSLKIHGVNLSLGGTYDPWTFGCGYSPICTELRGLWRQGVVVCVAAGNEGQIEVLTDEGNVDLNTSLSIGDPANLEECIAVGSVHADKPHLYGVSHFSSRGPTCDGRQKPDVVAPGEKIKSCNSHYRVSKKSPGIIDPDFALYRYDSGTSMACPHISGLIAAFLSVRNEFKGEPDKVKQILLANCNDLKRNAYHQGAGIPNLIKMLVNT